MHILACGIISLSSPSFVKASRLLSDNDFSKLSCLLNLRKSHFSEAAHEKLSESNFPSKII